MLSAAVCGCLRHPRPSRRADPSSPQQRLLIAAAPAQAQSRQPRNEPINTALPATTGHAHRQTLVNIIAHARRVSVPFFFIIFWSGRTPGLTVSGPRSPMTLLSPSPVAWSRRAPITASCGQHLCAPGARPGVSGRDQWPVIADIGRRD